MSKTSNHFILRQVSFSGLKAFAEMRTPFILVTSGIGAVVALSSTAALALPLLKSRVTDALCAVGSHCPSVVNSAVNHPLVHAGGGGRESSVRVLAKRAAANSMGGSGDALARLRAEIAAAHDEVRRIRQRRDVIRNHPHYPSADDRTSLMQLVSRENAALQRLVTLQKQLPLPQQQQQQGGAGGGGDDPYVHIADKVNANNELRKCIHSQVKFSEVSLARGLSMGGIPRSTSPSIPSSSFPLVLHGVQHSAAI
jgi:hypothetical protein